MLKELTFENLGLLDEGAAGAIANAEMKTALQDLEDRGHEDGKARKVVFELEMVKVQGGKVVTRLTSQAKIPPRRTNDTTGSTRELQGQVKLLFRDNNSDNDEQPTFEDVKGSK